MPDQPLAFDLKLLPDWLKETPGKNPYANYEGDTGESRPDRGGRPGQRPDRPRGGPPRGDRPGPPRHPGQPGRPGPPGQAGRPGTYGPPAGPPRGDHQRRGDRPDHPRRGGPPHGDRRAARDHGGPGHHRPPAAAPPPPVVVRFLPEPGLVEAIIKQIRGTGIAFPLLELARMFIAKPERHRVAIAAADAAVKVYQVGDDGPVALSHNALLAAAFAGNRDRYYRAETTELEAVRGNFTNVARCRATGTIFGPTNHHSYQATLRRHYQEHFASRVSFDGFLRQIEVTANPEAIEAWKNSVRTVTTFHTTQEPTELTFKSVGAAEQHFAAHYFPQLVRALPTAEMPGPAASQTPDRALAAAIRQAWEQECRFPERVMDALRRQLGEAGLIPFRRGPKAWMFTAVRPRPFKASGQAVSGNIAAILRIVESHRPCTRGTLAEQLIPAAAEAAERDKFKNSLAADLHWLVHAGFVIEYHDGTLELPLPPPPKKPQQPKGTHPPQAAPEPAHAPATAPVAPAATAAQPPPGAPAAT